MAEAWRDAGRFYVEVSAHDFQVPDEDGLVDWLECGVEAMESDRDLALLVAEDDGEVVGWVAARLVTPVSDARWQLATYAWLLRRRGAAVTRATAALNVVGAIGRAALTRDQPRRRAYLRWARLHARTGLGTARHALREVR